jgi:hypothetical protein
VRAGAGASFAVAVLAASAVAKAQSTGAAEAAVHVSPPECSARPVDFAGFVAALRVELGAEGYRVDQDVASTAPITLSIEASPCDAGATDVEIVVNGPPAGRFARTFSMLDVAPLLRARTAAIASAQLVLWSRQPVTLDGTPRTASLVGPLLPVPSVDAPPAGAATAPVAAPPPAAPPATAPPAGPAADASGALPAIPRLPRSNVMGLLGATGEYAHYVPLRVSLFGGRALSEWRLPWHGLAVRLDLAGATGSLDTPLGQVTLWTASAIGGGEWITDGEELGFAIGPMLEVGYTRVTGRAGTNAEQGSGGASTLGTVLLASLRRRIAGDTWAVLEADAGAELYGVRALVDDSSVGSTAGALFAARLGVAYAP